MELFGLSDMLHCGVTALFCNRAFVTLQVIIALVENFEMFMLSKNYYAMISKEDNLSQGSRLFSVARNLRSSANTLT